MKRDHSSPADGIERFRTTRWSLVPNSTLSHAPGYQALAELRKPYWYPLYASFRRSGFSAHDAQDLTQGFFLDLLEHKPVTRADRQTAKFRSFLLVCLQEVLSNEVHRARAVSGSTDFDGEGCELFEALIAAEGRILP